MKKNSSARKHGIRYTVRNRPRSSTAKKRQKALLRLRVAEKLAKGIFVR